MATYTPYRDPPLNSEARDTRVENFDTSDVTVEVIWQNSLDSLKGIAVSKIEFHGDKDPYDGKVVAISHGVPPRLESGHVKFERFVHSCVAKGFIHTSDTVIPWHRVYSLNVVDVVERKTQVKWRYEDRP